MNNLEFKISDKIVHKLTGQKMTIKKLNGSIATLIKDVPEPYQIFGQDFPGDIAICSVKNLIHT